MNNNNNNTTRMDANNPIQYNNDKNNNNKKEFVDVYIICKRVKPSKRITFTKKEDVQKFLLNLPYQLTPDHFLSKERTTEEYFITKLFESLLIGPKIFGSLHHFNQILTMTSDEFNLLVDGNGSRNKDSQTDKIKKSLSQLSPDFVFQKLYPKSSSFVIEFLNDFHKNNINNNNNNNNDINNNNNYNNDNNYNNNFNNDNNNYLQVERPHKPQTNAIDENAPPVLHFIDNCNDDNNNNNENPNYNLDYNDHQNNNNNNDDPMLIDNDSIMEHFPPQFPPDINLPFDPFDHFSIGEHGEGFDGEILRHICSMEQIDSESLDSFISSF